MEQVLTGWRHVSLLWRMSLWRRLLSILSLFRSKYQTEHFSSLSLLLCIRSVFFFAQVLLEPKFNVFNPKRRFSHSIRTWLTKWRRCDVTYWNWLESASSLTRQTSVIPVCHTFSPRCPINFSKSQKFNNFHCHYFPRTFQVICKQCNHIRDLDLCKDPYVDVSDGETWVDQSMTPLSRSEPLAFNYCNGLDSVSAGSVSQVAGNSH